MRTIIRNFSQQFSYGPKIENRGRWKKYTRFVVLGMGGSNLAAPLLLIGKPELRISVHRDYGLPVIFESEKAETLVICNSYSGNTEEVLDGFEEAMRQGLNVAAISIGGKLLERAKETGAPYIQMPDTGIQPRMALGFNTLALAVMMGEEEIVTELHRLTEVPLTRDRGLMAFLEEQGRTLAERIRGKVPVIYSSRHNRAIAYNWKIKLNETGKIPAFFNVFPELNHNEMTGFARADSTHALSERFYFIFLKDAEDHPRVQRRMDVTEKLYRERGLPVEAVPLEGNTVWEKIFSSLLLADWTALYLAEHYGVEAVEVPMVEDFKKML